MITGLIKANDEGFEDTTRKKGIEHSILTVKSDRPTKFQRKSVAFDAMHFKNPVPTAFKAQQIKENNVYRPKEFNKLNYTEDPFKVLFGYTKRINPDDNLNPKYYEFNLGNKNENSFIIENLQAESGVYTGAVEQREAYKDFLEARRLQEEVDKEYETEFKASVMTSPTKAKSSKSSTKGAKGSKAGGGGTIAVEPVRDVFKEFRDKTDIGDLKSQGEQVTKGEINAKGEMVGKGYVPQETEIMEALKGVGEYIHGDTTDRSSVIKLNKYLKLYGIEPGVTGKEKSYMQMKPKIEKFLEKVANQLTRHQIAQEAIKQTGKLTDKDTSDRLGKHKEKQLLKKVEELREQNIGSKLQRGLAKAWREKKEAVKQAEDEERLEEEQEREQERKRIRKFKASLKRQPTTRVVRRRAAAPAPVKAKPAPAPAPAAAAPTPTPTPAPAPAAPKATVMPTLTASLAPGVEAPTPAAAAPVRATLIPKPPSYKEAAAAAAPPPPALKLLPPPEAAGGAGQEKVKTPVAEVAKLPVEPKSAESLTIMIKDFEKAIANNQKPGRKAGDKISQEDVEYLKKYNKYFTTKVSGSSTVKTLIDKLDQLKIEQGLMNLPSPKKASPTSTTSQKPTKGK